MLTLVLAAPVSAQQPPQSGADLPVAFRDTRNYTFTTSFNQLRRNLEVMALAMQLREFCTNREVPDAFVRDRLSRLSQLSGRGETCRSLADY